jgi:type II restriction enzyme
MSDVCDIKPRFCSEKIFTMVKQLYDDYVRNNGLSFRLAIERFEDITEGGIRLRFGTDRSTDQMWRSCKGSLYEYAVCRALNEILLDDPLLLQQINIIHGSKLVFNSDLRDQVSMKNWSDIFPDVDFVIVNKVCNKAMAIISCKTSLRERLTETAFWSKELKQRGMEVIFITTDKDNEMILDINRYIVMHVLDYTIITDTNRYNQIINEWRKKYGHKPDFNIMISKIIVFSNIAQVLHKYAQKCQ